MLIENVSENIKNFWNEKETLNSFYYSRKKYAKEIFKDIKDFGGSLSLFQIRRKGKTSFLIYDLAKVASNDMFVFYFSFMQGKSGEDLVRVFKKNLIQFAVEIVAGKSNDFKNIINSNKPNLLLKTKKLSFNLKAFLEIGFSQEHNFASDEEKQKQIDSISLEEIFNFINQYRDKPILMLFDEFQEIANVNNESFIKTLRTELDIRKNYIHVVFTGSSYYGLENFFSQYNSPFFQFGIKMEFEDLDEDFLKHCQKVCLEKRNINVSLEDLKEVFEKNGKFPSYLIETLRKMMLKNDNKPQKYIISNNIESEFNKQKEKFESFNELEKLILLQIAKGKNEKINSVQNLSYFSKKLKKEINKNKVFYATNSLRKRNVIIKNKQLWKIVEKDFVEFLLSSNFS